MESILLTIKKLIGIDENYEHFDVDIITSINTALNILNQIGVGPEDGFCIKGTDEKWKDFIGDDIKIEMVKTYIYLKCKKIFDPPASSSLLKAIDEQIAELEWRLSVK